MATELQSPIGIVAGNGVLPSQVVEAAKDKGLETVMVAHIGETDPNLADKVKVFEWIKVGQLKKIIKTFKRNGVRQALFIGGIKKPKLFKSVWFDSRALKVIARVGTHDDAVLRGVAEELSSEGIELISVTDVLSESLAKVGNLGTRDFTDAETADVEVGWRAAKGIGSLDIGQTVVVKRGVVVAVEAVEGTDECIKRAGDVVGFAGSAKKKDGLVVVKVCKPQQDTRLDLPTIGVNTIENMHAAGATALVLEAGKALLVEPEAVRKKAVELGVAVRVEDGK